MTAFKDPMLRKVYDYCRTTGGNIGSSPLRYAYRLGRRGTKNMFVRLSSQHAAWAAGRDDYREVNKGKAIES